MDKNFEMPEVQVIDLENDVIVTSDPDCPREV